MERIMEFKVGDIVKHKVYTAEKNWGFGIVKGYSPHYGLYNVVWFDGKERRHTIELLKRIA